MLELFTSQDSPLTDFNWSPIICLAMKAAILEGGYGTVTGKASGIQPDQIRASAWRPALKNKKKIQVKVELQHGDQHWKNTKKTEAKPGLQHKHQHWKIKIEYGTSV